MPWHEHVGHVFHRRLNVKDVFGGNPVMGISHSANENTVIVVSDPYGNRYGYHDRFLENGSYEYYGQRAQQGDAWRNNNRQIRDHIEDGRSLLLFFKEDGEYRFDGEWFYSGYRTIEVGPVDRRVDQVVFNLVRGADLDQEALDDAIEQIIQDNADNIRRRAVEAGNRERNRQAVVNVYHRAAAVAAHVLRRANGQCECCGEAAPFLNRRGRPYLECHHIDRRADQGPDDIHSVIALHPVCHRYIHHARNGHEKNEDLRELMLRIEPRPVEG